MDLRHWASEGGNFPALMENIRPQGPASCSMTHSLLDTLIQHCAPASLIPSRIRPVVIGAVHAFPETVIAPEPEPRGVNDEEHDVHGIAFRVRKAEEAEDGEIERHPGDEREYQRVAVAPEIMRAPYPRGIERADEGEPERNCGKHDEPSGEIRRPAEGPDAGPEDMRNVLERHAPDAGAAGEHSISADAALMIEAPEVVHRHKRQQDDEVADEELKPPDAPIDGEPLGR